MSIFYKKRKKNKKQMDQISAATTRLLLRLDPSAQNVNPNDVQSLVELYAQYQNLFESNSFRSRSEMQSYFYDLCVQYMMIDQPMSMDQKVLAFKVLYAIIRYSQSYLFETRPSFWTPDGIDPSNYSVIVHMSGLSEPLFHWLVGGDRNVFEEVERDPEDDEDEADSGAEYPVHWATLDQISAYSQRGSVIFQFVKVLSIHSTEYTPAVFENSLNEFFRAVWGIQF